MTIRLVLLAAIYYTAGTIALHHFATFHASASPVWPPAGIALAAFLLLGPAAWPAIFAGAFLVNVTTNGGLLTSLAIAAGNTSAGFVGAELARRWAHGPRAFEHAPDVFRFVGLAAVPSAALSASIGVLALSLNGAMAWPAAGVVWLTWWLGDLAGELVVAPVVLLWTARGAAAGFRRRPLEAVLLTAALIAVGLVVFGGLTPFRSPNYPLAFLALPALVWASFRFGPVGASGGMLVAFALAVYGTLRSLGPFTVGTANESLLILQAFMIITGVTILPLAALVWDRQDIEQERMALLDRARVAQREAEERRRIAEEFAGVARSLTETLDVDAIGRRVVDAVLDLLNARASGLRLLAADGSLLGVAFGGVMKDAFPIGHALPGGAASVSGLAVAQRAAAFSDDVFADERLQMAADVQTKMRTAGDAAVLAVPLRAKGQIIGALSIADRRGRRFTPAEADMLQVFADQAAMAVENARLFEEAMQQRRESDVIAALAADINRALDVDRVLQRVAEAVAALCAADVSRIALHDPGSDTMSFRIGVGAGSVGAGGQPRIRAGEGLAGWVISTGRPYRTPDVAADPRRHGDFQPMIDAGSFRSVLIVPIHGEVGVEGLICVGRREVRPFSEREEMVCQRLAAHAAIAIRNSHLFAAERDARAEAHAANRAKDHFLATLSHELRTPLNAMLGWLRMLRNPRLEEAQKSHAVDVIERNARLQTQLINDLLDVSRIVAGKLELEQFPLDLVPVVQEAIEAVRADVESRALALVAELDPATGEVNGDPMRLQQVVTNLLSNAVKFTPSGGQVTVRLTREGEHARLTVADSGEGIDPDVLRHIFEPFLQADTSTRRTHQGLGLGLAIVRQLVEAHGGRVHAESAGRGQGATFVVKLPIVAVRAPRTDAPERRARAGSRLDGLRVLVVDDQSDAREVVGLVLRERGAEVHLAGSVAEALDLLGRHAIDVLVSDLAMPGADGYDLIRAVRAERASAIRAVALTAYTDHEVRERAIAAGFAAHATKPLNPDDLVELIAKLSV